MMRAAMLAAAVVSLSGCAGAMTRNAAFDWRGPHPVQQWNACENGTQGNRDAALREYHDARGKYRSAGSEAGAAIGAAIISQPGSIYRCMIAAGYTFEPMDWSDPLHAQYNEDYIRDYKEWTGQEIKNHCPYTTPVERRNKCAGY